MKDLNSILPPLPKHAAWGVISNLPRTNATIQEINRLLPHDNKWHSILGTKDFVDVDGITIRKHTKDRWT